MSATTSTSPTYVLVRLSRRELERQAAHLLPLEGLECIDLAPSDVVDEDLGELRFNVPPSGAGMEDLIVGILEARGVKVLASRTVSPRWHRRGQ